LKESTGEDFTAKDFRTWSATVLAARALRGLPEPDTRKQTEKNVVLAIEAVAGMLGNTRTVCRKSYVHPGIVGSYVDGTMVKVLSRRSRWAPRNTAGLRVDEVAVLTLLKYLQSKDSGRRTAA
jgi:DNA topoisomerase-1